MEYTTITAPASAELTEKRSRFLAVVAPARDEEQALEVVAEERASSRDASHHVYAFITHGTSRFTDDGEPQGTAGMPVLEVMRGAGLENAVVVVTRWFGGTLLGPGGLMRAYSQAAKLAISVAQTVRMRRCVIFSLYCEYRSYQAVAALAAQLAGGVVDADFGERVELRVFVPGEHAQQLLHGISELTLGSVHPEPAGEMDCESPV
ncbi:MAG: YigZ family protein [Clostridia bacterium]|nr:YigZ family protein [Clostridia bacterium]